jgi:hypothetical protein
MRGLRLIVALASLAPAGAAAQTLDQQAQALATMRAYVLAVCPPVQQQSRSVQTTAGAKLGADLPGLIKKLINLNAGISGEYKTAASQGVLQQDLAKAMEGQNSCRVSLSMALIPKLLGTPQPTLSPDRPVSSAAPARSRSTEAVGAEAAKNGVVVRVFL